MIAHTQPKRSRRQRIISLLFWVGWAQAALHEDGKVEYFLMAARVVKACTAVLFWKKSLARVSRMICLIQCEPCRVGRWRGCGDVEDGVSRMLHETATWDSGGFRKYLCNYLGRSRQTAAMIIQKRIQDDATSISTFRFPFKKQKQKQDKTKRFPRFSNRECWTHIQFFNPSDPSFWPFQVSVLRRISYAIAYGLLGCVNGFGNCRII